jgi:pectinesterase
MYKELNVYSVINANYYHLMRIETYNLLLYLSILSREKVFVPSSKPYISFIGSQNQSADTIITWNNKASDKDQNGAQLGTYRSASVAIESDYFCATGITFEVTNNSLHSFYFYSIK